MQYANVPEQLKVFPRWVTYKIEHKDGRKTKIPYNPNTGERAKAGQPQTWGRFEEAVAALNTGKYDGIGFEFHKDGFVGIDFDNCIENGVLNEWVSTWVARFNSYVEYSPSGTGIHIICEGELPDKAIKRPEAEMYDCGRFFTVTGKEYGLTRPLREAQEAINALYEEITPKKQNKPVQTNTTAVSLEDSKLLEIAEKAKNGSTFTKLYQGDWQELYKSQSEADIALCNMLAFYTGKDHMQMDRLFRSSGLMRDKWDRQQSGTTYGAITIQNSIDCCTEVYNPRKSPQEVFNVSIGDDDTILAKASDIPYEPPRWLIPPYFQKGKGTLIQADNGTGKTAFMCSIAAHVSTGEPILNIPVESPGNVLILSVEDDLPVLRGRIEASGGDLDKCYFITNTAGLTFNSPEIERAVKQIGAKLIIFDPFQAFLGAHIQMDKSNQTRPEMAKLFAMADRNDCSVAIIAHISKGSFDKSPVTRSLGSVDIPSSMRSIFHIIRNPENEHECVAVHVKCSNAPKGRSLAYSIGDRGGVHWNGFSSLTADDLNTVLKRKEKGVPYQNEPLVKVFNQLIANRPGGGFWSYEEVKMEGMKILGFPPFSTTNDLKNKLNGSLARELQEHDGLIVTCGHQSNSRRGIRIEQYQHPQGYQLHLAE